MTVFRLQASTSSSPLVRQEPNVAQKIFHFQTTPKIGVNELCIAFLSALFVTVLRRIRCENRDAYATYVRVPSRANRFETPWRHPHRVRLATLSEARHRVVYSALREQAGEGLGHHIRTMAADIGTALRLGVAYSHRKPLHGTLSRRDPDAVDKLFNLANGHMARNVLRDAVCDMDDTTRRNLSACPRCMKLQTGNPFGIAHVVRLPRSLTYDWGVRDELGASGKRKIEAFLKAKNHSRPYTLLEMPPGDCQKHVAAQFVGPSTAAYLFQRYWDAHGGPAHARRFGRSAQVGSLSDDARIQVGFAEHELNVAIHARRGDFFKFGRPRVAMATYGRVLRAVSRIVRQEGGAFARMPVVVRVYSEGLALGSEFDEQGHDMARRTTRFQDADGTVVEPDVVYSLLYEAQTFPTGFRLEMRVSADTLRSVHEMVAADIFIGSESTLGSVVVQSLSRGAAVLLPVRRRKFDVDSYMWRHALRTYFDSESGALLEHHYLEKLWRKFVRFTGAAARQAVADHEKRAAVHPGDERWPITRAALSVDDEWNDEFVVE